MRQEKLKEDKLKTLLLDAGLSEKENSVYLVLLKNGILSANEIIRLSGLKKGITYNILYRLAKEELIIQFAKKGIYYFQPNDPSKLSEMIVRRSAFLSDVSRRIENLYPELKSMYKLATGKPTIRYFEGEEGIREIFEDIYGKKEGKNEVYGCVDLEKADEVFPSYITSELIPKRIKNRIFAYSLVADSPEARKIASNDKNHLRKATIIDKKKYPLPAEIDVYDDKIAMLSFAKGEFIGILIENKDMAVSLKSILRIAIKSV